MPKLTGGQALAKSLYREGVRVIFGLVGAQLYYATDALYDEPGIQWISARNEQATTFMADGYARASGEVGTAMVVPGPGVLNATSGLSTAYSASSPVLLVAGQIPKNLIGVNRGMLHEIDDQLEAVKSVTKWAARTVDAVDVPETVHEAFHQLKTGRPRPVEIEIPPDTLSEETDVDLLEPAIHPKLVPQASSIAEAAKLLANSAGQVVIWAGGGATSPEASTALTQLAEHLQAPVITTSEGKGSITDRHYLSVGVPKVQDPSMRKVIEDHPVVLAVGTRMATANLPEGHRVIQIDVDAEEIGRNHKNTLAVLGDSTESLKALHKATAELIGPQESREDEYEAFRKDRYDPANLMEPQGSYTRAIRAAIPDDGILVSGMTQIGYFSRAYYPVYQPRTYITSSYSGNLGYAYPTALGAKVAQPDKAVVCVSGDGGFMYNSQELATAAQYGINVVAVVFNDNAFGNVLRDQTVRLKGRLIGTELHNPDFVKLAEAHGVTGIRVNGADELEAALKEALAANAPALIEVPVEMMESSF
ncbi:MAG: thiamine pyrophosphate-binding protein [SAR202 cluster bacterium]|nr:thiamine pyrophosphate-binding protein [SAR202 cluster bacterium]